MFGYLRISPKSIDLPTYHALLQSGTIQKAKVEGNEVFLYGLNEQFVIIKDGIDVGELLKKVPIEVQTNNPMMEEFTDASIAYQRLVCFVILRA